MVSDDAIRVVRLGWQRHDISGVGASDGKRPASFSVRQNTAGIGWGINAGVCTTLSGGLVPGITAQTTGCAAQNCNAAARISTPCAVQTSCNLALQASNSADAG